MGFYARQHQYYRSIDLHARVIHIYVLDAAGAKLAHRNFPAQPAIVRHPFGGIDHELDRVSVRVSGARPRDGTAAAALAFRTRRGR